MKKLVFFVVFCWARVKGPQAISGGNLDGMSVGTMSLLWSEQFSISDTQTKMPICEDR
jgi:hypothetical protein